MAKNWLIEFCLKCDTNISQIPVPEDAPGEDVNVRQAVQDYRDMQKNITPFRCDCGEKLIARYATTRQQGVVVRVNQPEPK